MKLNRIDPLIAIGRIRIAMITEALAKYALWELLQTLSTATVQEMDVASNAATAIARELAHGDEYCEAKMPEQFKSRPALMIAWEAGIKAARSPSLLATYWDGYNCAGRRFDAIPPTDCWNAVIWLCGYEAVRQMNLELANEPQQTTQTSMPNEADWRAICERIANSVNAGGGGYEHYVNLLSSAIDDALLAVPLQYRDAAITIAKEWDYATLEERDESAEWGAEHGYCSHGIELGCCPAGCGSY